MSTSASTVYSLPAEPYVARLEAVKSSPNPLLEASRVLLRALCDMPDYLTAEDREVLRQLLEHEVRTFEKLCDEANVRRDHRLGASYCLCTALDEGAMQTKWGSAGNGGVEWITTGLASTFHQDREGGDKIYLLIARLLAEPYEHIDLLEVIYRVVSLGFSGRYRFEPDGNRKHDAVRQRLYSEIVAQRGLPPAALSPHWVGDTQGRGQTWRALPVWVTALGMSLILLASFAYAKYRLATRTAAVQQDIATLGRLRPLAERPGLHLKTLLKDEIAAAKVSVDEDEHHTAVTFHGDDMFVPGRSAVNASMVALIGRIAGEVRKVPGKVTVTGHTDNAPIRSRAFPSNQALSEARAQQVVQMLHGEGVPQFRLEAVGRGDTAPIADNRTPQGRARNRRVQIDVVE